MQILLNYIIKYVVLSKPLLFDLFYSNDLISASKRNLAAAAAVYVTSAADCRKIEIHANDYLVLHAFYIIIIRFGKDFNLFRACIYHRKHLLYVGL